MVVGGPSWSRHIQAPPKHLYNFLLFSASYDATVNVQIYPAGRMSRHIMDNITNTLPGFFNMIFRLGKVFEPPVFLKRLSLKSNARLSMLLQNIIQFSNRSLYFLRLGVLFGLNSEPRQFDNVALWLYFPKELGILR